MNHLIDEVLTSVKFVLLNAFHYDYGDEGEGLTVDELKWKQFCTRVFCKQLHDWDCGLACCAMVMNWTQQDPFAVYDHDMAKRTTPLWTIELFTFLQNEGISSKMSTLSIGLQSHHHNIDWYAKMNQNEAHIDELFVNAKENSLPIEERSYSMEDLQSILCDEHRTVAIMLIDSLTIANRRSDEAYAGHYILVLKYDHWSDDFLYLNPAGRGAIERIDSKLLDAARRHLGTDEDIIFCYKDVSHYSFFK